MEDQGIDRLHRARTAGADFQNGELVYELPELNDIKAYCRQQIHTLWDEVKRFENPHTYYVDLSQKLWDVKRGLLEAAKC